MAEGQQPIMGWYRVCLNTIVRKDVKLDSERLRILPMGSRVNVVKKDGRRVMIDQPIKDDTSTQTPRSNPEAQAAHYKQEANKALEQAKNAKEEEEKKALQKKAEQYDALSAQVLAQRQAHEHELASLSQAATSTNVQNMVFRDGDVIQLTKKNHDKGLVIVRKVVNIKEKEWIGVDYAGDSNPFFPAEGGTHPDSGNIVHFKSGYEMKGGWVHREEVQGYISGGSIIPQLNAQVVENQLLKSTLTALKTIIKELDQEQQYKGIFKVIFEKASAYQMQE